MVRQVKDVSYLDDNDVFCFVKEMYRLGATVETNPIELIEIHDWHLLANVFPYAPARDRTPDQMVNGPKYLPLGPYYVGR